MTDIIEEEPVTVLPSILGGLRASRAKIGAGSKPLDLTIPGYDNQLVIRFKWVAPEVLSRTAPQILKIKEPTEQRVSAAADALVATCAEVLVREDGEVKPLSTDGEPVTFRDKRLAYALGFDNPGTAREVAIRTINNDYTLIDLADTLMAWLEDSSLEIDKRYLGE